MTRTLLLCFAFAPLVAGAGECDPRITQADAIRVAKQEIAKEFGAKAVSHFGPYTVKLEDCRWIVRAATPPRDVSGDVLVSINARTGVARMEPRMRTDPHKLERVYGKPR